MSKEYEQAKKILDKCDSPFILFTIDEEATILGTVKGMVEEVELMFLNLMESILETTSNRRAQMGAMVMIIHSARDLLLNHFENHEIEAIKKRSKKFGYFR